MAMRALSEIAIVDATRPKHAGARKIRGARVRQKTGTADEERKLLACRRKQNREYMRRWRTSPENRAKENLRVENMRWQRSLDKFTQLPSDAEKRRCAYCHHESVMRIERLRATERGFKKVQLPYCGQC
ncbi:MAG: hypothetical protein WAK91_03000 [Candidatus Acidiferrales bacterium]|jgi:hypothetical protein